MKISNLRAFSRKISYDDGKSEHRMLYLGKGRIKIRRGLKADSPRELEVSVSANLNTDLEAYLRVRFVKPAKAGRVFELTYLIEKGQLSLRHINLRALAGKQCNQQETRLAFEGNSGQHSDGQLARPALRSSATYKTFTLATDCDYECYQALGQSQANDRILEFINSARIFYNRDLGFDLLVTSQRARLNSTTYPASLTKPENLLSTFFNLAGSLPSADLKHLITGKDMEENNVGLSYLEVTCSRPDYSLGFSQHQNSLLTPIVIAHELGHNLGADHDPADQGLMMKVVSLPYPDAFSAYSQNQINSYIDSLGELACHEEADDNDVSPPALSYNPRLTAKYRGDSFSIKLTQPEGSNCLEYLSISARESGLFRPSSMLNTSVLSSGQSMQIAATKVSKVALKAKGKRAPVYIRAKAVCPEGSGYSAIQKINVGKFLSKQTGTGIKTVQAWIAQFKAKLAGSLTK